MGMAELLGPEELLCTDVQRDYAAHPDGQSAPRRPATWHDQQSAGPRHIPVQQDNEAVERRQRVLELPHAALAAVQLLATADGCDPQLSVAAKRKNAGGGSPARTFPVRSPH